jgi:hypothetical protein
VRCAVAGKRGVFLERRGLGVVGDPAAAAHLWHVLGCTDAVRGLYCLLMWPAARLLGMSELDVRLPSAIPRRLRHLASQHLAWLDGR